MDTIHLSRSEMLDVLTFFTVRAALEAIAPKPITDNRDQTIFPVGPDVIAFAPRNREK